MKVKLDENIPVRLAGVLATLGHNVDTVASEGLKGRPDGDVWSAAQREGRPLQVPALPRRHFLPRFGKLPRQALETAPGASCVHFSRSPAHADLSLMPGSESKGTIQMYFKFAIGLILILLALPALARTRRSAAQRAAFVSVHHCPSTGRARGPCPGYVVDHVVPLCAGGPDRPGNMQWQTVEDAKTKDRAERALCRHQSRPLIDDSDVPLVFLVDCDPVWKPA